MPLNQRELQREYPKVLRIFGTQCFACGITRKDYGKKFMMHETIYARPIQTMNLRPICRSCNRKRPFLKEIILATQAIPVGITISQRNKKEFEKWLDGQLELNNNYIDRKRAIYEGCNFVGR